MKKILILLFSLWMLAGCEDFLDLQPVNEQPEANVLNLKSNIQAVLNKAYDRIQDHQFLSGRAILAAELYGDNLDLNTTSLVSSQDYGPFVSRNFGIFNNVSRNVWTTGYAAIYHANIVIGAVEDNVFEATDEEKNLLKAEALFIRGLTHHVLVRLFSLPYSFDPSKPGVIIRTSAPTREETFIPQQRATIQEVYEQVIDDLKAAEALLPSTNGGKATKWAAKALLARVYFDMADYPNAYAYADDVIKNGGFTLGADVVKPFRNVGAAQADGGAIFQILNVASDDGTNGDEGLRKRYWNSTPANIMMSVAPAFVSTFNPVDKRLTLLIDNTKVSKPFSLKFQGTKEVNVPVIRLAEMYLTRAESAVRKGGFVDTDVRADYNILRTLAGLATDDVSSTADELLAAIQAERRLELAMEGDRSFELRRLKQNLRGLAYSDPTQLLKIPDSETRANPDIIQN